MVSKTCAIYFRLKRPETYKKGSLPIYLRITVDGRRAELAAKRSIDPARWNAATGRAIGTKEEGRMLNSYLECLQQKAYKAHQSLIDAREAITAEKVKNKLRGVAERLRFILEIFRQHNGQIKALVGTEYAPLTYRRYATALGIQENLSAGSLRG